MFKLSQITVALFIIQTTLSSCQKKPETKVVSMSENSNIRSCSIPTDSLLGKTLLDSKFLAAIDKVPTNDDSAKSVQGMVKIKGGIFDMGGDFPSDYQNMPATALPQNDELPKHKVEVSDYYMDEHEVTVREFLAFVQATGYKTVAEYDIDWEELKKQLPPGTPKPSEEDLKAGAMIFKYVPKGTAKDNLANWWSFVTGVNWKNPDNTNPKIEDILDQPVRQVSWYDAMAYAKWMGKRLPTEAEFEYAMRAGKQNSMYPWGNDKVTDLSKQGNFLQGEFPYENNASDGYLEIANVKSFPPNAYGLYDIAGNVWEWTLDWYGADYYNTLKEKGAISINPQGPEKAREVYDPYSLNKVVRGGSFLCNDSWCSGFRNARRMRLSVDSGMQHLGFRCVRDANP